MGEGLSTDGYDALVAAADTYRSALIVRLAGEAGLRTGEITRVRPGDVRESAAADAFLLAVPSAADGEVEGGTDDDEIDDSEHTLVGADRDASPAGIDREAYLPASLAAELRRYADGEALAPDEPFVDVSARRVQMIVRETATRAGDRAADTDVAGVTPGDLRRFFARRLLVDRGVDPHVVRETGGWDTLGALDAYLDPLDGDAIAEGVAGATAPARDAEDVGARSPVEPSPLVEAFAAIVDAADRAAAFEATVDGAVAADRWSAAWVLTGSASGTSAEVAATAGDDTDSLGDGEVVMEDGPWTAALADGTVAVSDDVGGLDGRPVVAAPIAYRDAVYGAICAVAEAPGDVSRRDRRELSVLGRAVGWAVTADRWRDLLHSDAVTEVEFHTASNGAFLAAATAALDCRIDLQSTVAVSEAAFRCYLRVTGATAQALAEVVAAAAGVSDTQLIEAHEDGCSASVLVADGSVVHTLTEHGATVRTATAEHGRVSVVADVPSGTDVRPIADGLRAAFPDARLVSKESVARSPTTESTLREDVTERFTDRQWAALSAAYRGGYFDWPRGSTAEEVADAMDVSSPTFHNHLRKAQRALLDAVFDATDR